MKITSVTGVESIENVKCFKPISKVFVKIIYPDINGANAVANYSDPQIRVRLVDGRAGSSREIVPEMNLSILSEIASKYEGFQRQAAPRLNDADLVVLRGYSLSSVIIGQQLTDDVIAAVDLSNDKYVDIDLRGLNPKCTYEIWGMESHLIQPFCRTYQKYYLSAGEIEKTFGVGENEVLVYPIDDIKEIQLFSKNSGSSPVFRREELIIDEDGRNDLVFVGLDENNICSVSPDTYNLPIRFGYSRWGVMSVVDFSRFEIRRDDGLKTLTFLMIDTVPSVAVAVE